MAKLVMSRDEISAFLIDVFPELFPAENPPYKITSIDDGSAVLSLTPDASHLRPGATVSGPTIMTLADLAMYVLVLGHIGPVALAVTTNLSINFLRKPTLDGALLGRARLLKLGRSLAVGDVIICSENAPDVAFAHASVTYSIPPK